MNRRRDEGVNGSEGSKKSYYKEFAKQKKIPRELYSQFVCFSWNKRVGLDRGQA